MVKSFFHLVKRFIFSLHPFPPSDADVAWVSQQLSRKEEQIWSRLGVADRRHSVQVARDVVAKLDGRTYPDTVLAAALLHDCGKIVCRFNPFFRVFATVFWFLFERTQWGSKYSSFSVGSDFSGFLNRFDDRKLGGNIFERLLWYRNHPAIGSDILLLAGAEPLVSSWAAQHHVPKNRWGRDIPIAIGEVLKACDND